GQLALAPIDYDELRQGLPLLQESFVPSVYHLFHTGKIIRAVHTADVEMPVILFGGLSVLKDNTGGHRVASLDVRIVKTFDMPGLHREPEVGLHLGHDPVRMPVRIDDP